jgi:hypothetical protein
VPGLILAAINPDNTPHGYNWTFAFPMVLFLVIAAVLYALFSRPHRRVPPQRLAATASSAEAPEPDVARAASVAGGLSLAAGGGTSESEHEPAGAHLAASINPEDMQAEESAATGASGEPDGDPEETE